MSSPCHLASVCRNSPDYKGEQSASCALCRLSPDNRNSGMTHFWNPIKGAIKKHPDLERERRHNKALIHIENLKSKSNRDKTKIKISRLARYAEKKTEKSIIKATKNSGRSNKDGDHVLYESITLDTKLQTTRSNPIVQLFELDKVRMDAVRAGKIAGGLLIRNKHGVGIIVFSEEDVPILLKRENE